jgi:hypothetical protein
MTTFRWFTLPVHAVLELATGLALIVAPFALGFTSAGLVVSVALGALIVGLALSGASRESGGLPIATHLAFDRTLALASAAAAIALALHDDRAAALVLAAAAFAQLALSVTTRYSAPA